MVFIVLYSEIVVRRQEEELNCGTVLLRSPGTTLSLKKDPDILYLKKKMFFFSFSLAEGGLKFTM